MYQSSHPYLSREGSLVGGTMLLEREDLSGELDLAGEDTKECLLSGGDLDLNLAGVEEQAVE